MVQEAVYFLLLLTGIYQLTHFQFVEKLIHIYRLQIPFSGISLLNHPNHTKKSHL